MEIDDEASSMAGPSTARRPARPRASPPSPPAAPAVPPQRDAGKPTKSSKRRARRKSKRAAELMAKALAAPAQPGSPRLQLKLQKGRGSKICGPCQKVMVLLIDGLKLSGEARGTLKAAAAAALDGVLRGEVDPSQPAGPAGSG
ncbi:hypothetical protein Rsub_10164 [Raphidocelis subcapitata]|uniref:Uncharacterized protein n=1 Tax=Raphidocelis subcapitata TaxID=307507 RepID=A0A2V0PI03_9CHLO|nr:hypothetical protein Rsub_10164 [Raphidocelis subcapitata]|eukprot:GBF97563.1 hypothetical protein Rsub_10164 [Raphidocelis subcapitata]